jgi:hypothetical protein
MIFQFSYSTFFKVNCYFWGEPAICDISAHRLISPRRHHRPIAFIEKDWQRKKNGEKRLHFDDVSVLLLTFFSIKLLFRGEPAICDISAHRLIFSPPPPPPDRIY